MTNEEIFGVTVLNSWRLVINRFNKTLSELSDEQLQQQAAQGGSRVFYLLGHLTAMHDRMFPLLGIGERLHTELDEPYIANPDRELADPLSATELRRAWAEVNDKLTSPSKGSHWKTGCKSTQQFPMRISSRILKRNRLAVVMKRTSHSSYHAGQAALTK
jgi:hypothetical protein